ncbi:TrmH family RNA methyltransferase [Aureibaculum marinum]|uniref:tRNA (guanosine(18)-2'-O)-methyltransferase n=1 Tax=Aureibaculum marinum TaxID=2487930 RepID=A0A3N4P115_9FLAO|nr:RNA methyltransferase [Aureibaculum marinum]RPD98696.1 TrmH family RNA methyltransferase [Aureibaculum marinum]
MVDKQLLSYLQELLTENRKNLFEKILKERTRHFTVVLEDIYQKHNTSAVVRSCDVFGIQDIHIIENKYNSYVSNQVAKGAQKWIDFYEYNQQENNTENCIKSLRGKGYQIIATTPHNDSCLLQDFDITKKSALVFGVEKEGVSDYMLKEADGYLKIPMYGFTESLNISVAVAIILQSLSLRLRTSNINWQLTEQEKEEKRMDWTKKSINHVDEIIERWKSDN